jgi:hypothetical protein
MLSESARGILGLIAEGRGYDQILQQHPELTYFDIFAAAREALELAQAASSAPTPEGVAPLGARAGFDEGPASTRPKRLPAYIERARATHRRAWARWTHEQDAQLTALFQRGDSRADMVQALGRQPGAIRNRLLKLGLIPETDDEDGPSADLGPGEAAQLLDLSPGPADGGGRSEREPASPVVAGWESFRRRLSDESGAT